jgi:hypothetical protein
VASIFDGRRKLKIKRSASDARTAGINDITSPRYDYPSIFLVALLDYQRKLDLYSLILSGLRATRTLLISENRSGARPPTDVRIADEPLGAPLTHSGDNDSYGTLPPEASGRARPRAS